MAKEQQADQPAELDDDDAAVRYQERLRAQYGEYGQWVAVDSIYHEGALAFAPGHPVPAGHVERYGYDRMEPPLVRRPDGWKEPTDG